VSWRAYSFEKNSHLRLDKKNPLFGLFLCAQPLDFLRGKLSLPKGSTLATGRNFFLFDPLPDYAAVRPRDAQYTKFNGYEFLLVDN
jgi:hypothetical protein